MIFKFLTEVNGIRIQVLTLVGSGRYYYPVGLFEKLGPPTLINTMQIRTSINMEALLSMNILNL
jgi:hypothetical protein